MSRGLPRIATGGAVEPSSYWGTFATTGALPNAAGSATQDATLEVGDTAYVTTQGQLYVCVDSTLGAADWIAAGQGVYVTTHAAAFTLDKDEQVVHLDTTAGNINVTLPAASLRQYLIKKMAGANTITLLSGGVNIEGAAANLVLPGSAGAPATTAPQVWILYSDGAGWWIG